MANERVTLGLGASDSRRRIIFGALGAVLLVSGALLAWGFGKDEYYEFYLIPRDKGDPLFPRRWQDLVFISVIWTILVAWLGLAYWSLKRAFSKRPLKPHS